MIFDARVDNEYRRWFAWRPVVLHGPNEWDRMKFTGKPARIVWLQFVWRMRTRPQNYYVLFDWKKHGHWRMRTRPQNCKERGQ